MNSNDLKKLLAGDRRALAKSITMIESRQEGHLEESQKFLESILPHTGKTLRIGITGIPGVGKSTFIESLGLFLVRQGKRVAVLTVDPSSPLCGGSILGDRTRMEELSQKSEVFIRTSPSGGSLGGVALKTRETMLLCEASGYDVILIETVGVGQSEVEVASMVDFFLVLMVPNAGDELQGIKKGLLELADAIVINKADGDNEIMARRSLIHYQNAMNMVHHPTFWQPRVMTCSAFENKNIDSIWSMILEFEKESKDRDLFQNKRAMQNKEWMQKIIREKLDLMLKQNAEIQKIWPLLEDKVIEGKTTPYLAAKKIIDKL